jgi:hypothetical protein
MSELWLPSDRLVRRPFGEIALGQLLVLPPSGSDFPLVQIGIRCGPPDAVAVLGFTPFYGGANKPWDLMDFSRERGDALTLDSRVVFETGVHAPAGRGKLRETAPGEIVEINSGLGIAAYIGRNENRWQTVAVVNLSDWQLVAVDEVRTIFGTWRLRIDLDQHRPIYWQPELAERS